MFSIMEVSTSETILGLWLSLWGLPRWLSGGGNGNPLQYSCLENPMDRRAWQACGVTKT